jgi:crotonobetainyl-CoA:carnitine CoA-transferase CaiB-like acyl-CoA transferase
VAGVPCARVNNFKDVFAHPQIVARGVVKEVEHPRLGKMRTTRNPILFDHGGPSIDRHSPMLGEHSAQVLGELGYLPATIGDLVAAGVTRTAALPKGSVQAAE